MFCTTFSFSSWMRQRCIFFTNRLTAISSWEQTDLNNPAAMRRPHTLNTVLSVGLKRASKCVAWAGADQSSAVSVQGTYPISSSPTATYTLSTTAATAHPQHTNGAHFWQRIITGKREPLTLSWFQADIKSNSPSGRAAGYLQLTMERGGQYS